MKRRRAERKRRNREQVWIEDPTKDARADEADAYLASAAAGVPTDQPTDWCSPEGLAACKATCKGKAGAKACRTDCQKGFDKKCNDPKERDADMKRRRDERKRRNREQVWIEDPTKDARADEADAYLASAAGVPTDQPTDWCSPEGLAACKAACAGKPGAKGCRTDCQEGFQTMCNKEYEAKEKELEDTIAKEENKFEAGPVDKTKQNETEEMLKANAANKKQQAAAVEAMMKQKQQEMDAKQTAKTLENLQETAKEYQQQVVEYRRAVEFTQEEKAGVAPPQANPKMGNQEQVAKDRLERLKELRTAKKNADVEYYRPLVSKSKQLSKIGGAEKAASDLRKIVDQIHYDFTHATLKVFDAMERNLLDYIDQCQKLRKNDDMLENRDSSLLEAHDKVDQLLKKVVAAEKMLVEEIQPLVKRLDATKAIDLSTFRAKDASEFQDGVKVQCLRGGVSSAMLKVRQICEEESCGQHLEEWKENQELFERDYSKLLMEVEKLPVLQQKQGGWFSSGSKKGGAFGNGVSYEQSRIKDIKGRYAVVSKKLDLGMTKLSHYDAENIEQGDSRLIQIPQSNPLFARQLEELINRSKVLKDDRIRLTKLSCDFSLSKCDKTTGAMIPNPFPYQRLAQFVGSPQIVGQGGDLRLALIWRTGAGKTLGVIKMLDNFYDDPRPKVLIFPTKSVASNFYSELAEYHNKYLEFAVKRGTYNGMTKKNGFGIGPRPNKGREKRVRVHI